MTIEVTEANMNIKKVDEPKIFLSFSDLISLYSAVNLEADADIPKSQKIKNKVNRDV
jgi:hypothetical protein